MLTFEMFVKLTIFLYLMLISFSAVADGYMCVVGKKYYCEYNNCTQIDTQEYYTYINTVTLEYNICDPQEGCDYFDLEDVIISGAFMTFKTGNNSFLKMAMIDAEPFEI